VCLFHRQRINYITEHLEQVAIKKMLLPCGSNQSSNPLQ